MRIAIEAVSFAYDPDTPALTDVGLGIASGESVALAGPNGSGKSTLLRVVSGLLRPQSGSVHIDDRPVDSLGARRIARCLAMVEQDRSMGFDFTVREVVAMGRIPHRGRFGRESHDDRRAIAHALEVADIQGLADRSIRAVSGGERQRVFLGMALAQEPAVLLLDEPTTHLDLRHQVRFMRIVRERAADGMTILIAIHDLTLAAQAADRIALMHAGRIAEIGPPGDVLTTPNVRRVFGVDAVIGEHPDLRMLYVLPALADRNARSSEE